MKEKRSFEIKSKIVTPADVRRIANLFYDISSEYVNSVQKNDPNADYRRGFKVVTTDGTEYSTATLDIFKSEGILDSKNVQEIGMSFWVYKLNTDISIRLRDSRYNGWGNHISVEGIESTWVSGTFSRLLECVNSWKNQSSIGKKYKWLISVLIGLLLGWAIGTVVLSIISVFSAKFEFSWLSPYLIPFMGFAGFGTFIAEHYITKLWPEIEIVSGPEHSRELSKKRKRITFVLTAIVLPLTLGVLGSIIGTIIAK